MSLLAQAVLVALGRVPWLALVLVEQLASHVLGLAWPVDVAATIERSRQLPLGLISSAVARC